MRLRWILAIAALQIAGAAQGPAIEGLWLGTIETGSVKLRLGLKISAAPGGGWSGTLNSLDQSANNLPLSGLEQQGASVKFALKAAGAAFEGTLDAAGAAIAGTWRQGGGSLPLVFHRVDQLPSIVRPQEPKKPYPYTEEEVAYDNKPGGSHLAGTLTLPTGAGPFPAALLITGSGQQDRDEALMGHKPFLVLADYLTRKGIAVLRVDDRGMGGSTGDVVNATTEDFAGDTLAGVRFLQARKGIDPRRIGLIGHSEGGAIAPMVAAREPGVAFIVMLAGTGVPGEQVSLSQSEALAKSMGASGEAMDRNREVQRQVMALVKEEADPKVRQRRLEALAAQLTAATPAAAPAMTNQFRMAASPWFRFFTMYDPAPTLAKVTCPVLALNGELDTQVIASLNLPPIVKALEAGGNRDYEVVKFPGLNHLFQTAKSGLPDEYARIEETMAPVALETIAAWILRHTRGAVVVSP